MALSFGVNWVGVIVGNIALLVIGFVWFMPNIFGSRWIALMGRPGEQLKPGPDFILSVLSGTLNSFVMAVLALNLKACLLYTSPSPRDLSTSRMPSSA